ncbi:MAG: DUF4263 domain-containing protein, partial [Nitrosopumilus sp.]
YLNYKIAYWKEFRSQTHSVLSNYREILPDFYLKHLKLIVFDAKDGLVGIYFDKKVTLHHKQIDHFLSSSWNKIETDIQYFSIKPFSELSILALVQWLSSDLINFEINGKIFDKISLPSYVTNFPDLFTYDPKTGNKTKNKNFIVISLKNNKEVALENLKGAAICLRDFQIEDVETSQRVFEFLWREINIYGESMLINLNTTDAKLQANRDILAIIGSRNIGIPKNKIKTNPENELIEKLNEIINSFCTLMDDEYSTEHEIQDYLKSNPILLMPDYLKCLSHPQLGSEYEPDFILVGGSNSGEFCVLIEIESSSHQLFIKNGDPSAALKHAEKQIRDWRAWLRENAVYAQKTLRVNNLHSNSLAQIVIGRRSTILENNHLKQLQAINADYHGETVVRTYDDIIDSTRKWIENIKQIK